MPQQPSSLPDKEGSDLNEENIMLLKAELRIRESTAPPRR